MKYGYLLLVLFNATHGSSCWGDKPQTCPATKDHGEISCTLSRRDNTLRFKDGRKITTCKYDSETQMTVLESTGTEQSHCSESGLVTLLYPEVKNLTLDTMRSINRADSERFSKLLPTLKYIASLAAAINKAHPDDSLPHAFVEKHYRSNRKEVSLTSHYEEFPPLLSDE